MSMIETLILLIIVLWLVGTVSSYTIGGLIHILLLLAAILLLFRIFGRR